MGVGSCLLWDPERPYGELKLRSNGETSKVIVAVWQQMLINTEPIGVLTKQLSDFLGIKEQAPKYAGLWIRRAERKLNTANITQGQWELELIS